MLYKHPLGQAALVVMCACLFTTMSGCTAADAAAVTELESGLNSLLLNRTAAETLVRDIKADVPSTNPDYVRAMESYEDAKSVYERYLDSVEEPKKERHSRSLHEVSPRDVQQATTNFLADGITAIRPTVNTRRARLESIVVVPDDLQKTFQKIPSKAREALIDKFDQQVRWSPWSDL